MTLQSGGDATICCWGELAEDGKHDAMIPGFSSDDALLLLVLLLSVALFSSVNLSKQTQIKLITDYDDYV